MVTVVTTRATGQSQSHNVIALFGVSIKVLKAQIIPNNTGPIRIQSPDIGCTQTIILTVITKPGFYTGKGATVLVAAIFCTDRKRSGVLAVAAFQCLDPFKGRGDRQSRLNLDVGFNTVSRRHIFTTHCTTQTVFRVDIRIACNSRTDPGGKLLRLYIIIQRIDAIQAVDDFVTAIQAGFLGQLHVCIRCDTTASRILEGLLVFTTNLERLAQQRKTTIRTEDIGPETLGILRVFLFNTPHPASQRGRTDPLFSDSAQAILFI